MRTKKENSAVKISAPNFKYIKVKIKGSVPYLSNRFQNRDGFIDKYIEGNTKNRTKNKNKQRDFDKEWVRSVHWSKRGNWAGLPATAFRNGMIAACRLVDYKMTLAKLSVFVEADGISQEDGLPIIKITKGKFRKHVAMTRNKDGSPNVVARGILDEGWEADLVLRFDGDQFNEQDVVNLLSRVGQQVGIGAGRPNSKDTPGIGMGLFDIVGGKKKK